MALPNRGGTCVLIKNYLSSQLTEIDISKPDQVWLNLRCLPSILFGFLYIPPHDSPYFSETRFSSIQEKLKTEKSVRECVLVGDINARMGRKVIELPEHLDVNDLSYPTIPDTVQVPNGNANMTFSLCCDEKLVILNNAKLGTKRFNSNLTYKKGSVWTSELDLCLVSPNMLEMIEDFNITHDLSLPSDHAPLSFSVQQHLCLDKLAERASFLGDHAALYSKHMVNVCRKPIRFTQINPN